MRPSERLWAESELRAGGASAAGDRTLADDPAKGFNEPEARRGLAGRLARLPAAHPSALPDAVWSGAGRSDAAWPGAGRSDAAWPGAGQSDAVCVTDALGTAGWRTAGWRTAVPSTADRVDYQRGGDQASEDTWWRGESDIWWRVPDRSAGEADYDDEFDGLSELADADDGFGDPGGTGGPDEDGGPDDADATGDADDQGGGTGGQPGRPGRRTPGPAGRDLGQPDGHWGEVGGPHAGRNQGSYRPWFSQGVAGDPWFAAGLEYPAGG